MRFNLNCVYLHRQNLATVPRALMQTWLKGLTEALRAALHYWAHKVALLHTHTHQVANQGVIGHTAGT